MNKYSLAATIAISTCTMLQLGVLAQSTGTSQATPTATLNAVTPSPTPGLPSATSPGAPVPSGGQLGKGAPVPTTTTNMPNATDIINPSMPRLENPPPMDTIIKQVTVTVDKQPIKRGPFTGLMVHLHNGTKSPLMFDGDAARVRIGADQLVTAISDKTLEAAVAPPPSKKHELHVGIDNALTVGWSSSIHDELQDRGPILPRFEEDQLRREATLERFGLRILWPGDETQGIVFFAATGLLDSGKLEVPVASFPTMEIRGYLTGLR